MKRFKTLAMIAALLAAVGVGWSFFPEHGHPEIREEVRVQLEAFKQDLFHADHHAREFYWMRALDSATGMDSTKMFYRYDLNAAAIATALGYTPYNGGSNPNGYVNQAGARSAISLTTSGTSGAATYNNGTGVLNIPNYTPGAAPGTNNASAYSAGSVYSLTTTSQKVDFGTTDPVVTIPAAGTYLIFTNLKIQYNGLTTALNACSFKLRRTNNTAADLTNANTGFNVPAATVLTGTGGDCDIPPVMYTTSNSNDVLELWGNRSSGITLGSIEVGEASVMAVRIY